MPYYHGNGSLKRQAWMQETEQRIIEKQPSARGNIHWDTLVYFFNRGDTTEQAARDYVSADLS